MARRTTLHEVIRDSPFELSAEDEEIEKSKELPFSGIEAVDRNEKGLVSFLATPLTAHVELRVHVNGVPEKTFDLRGKDILRGVWEAFSPSEVALHADQENRVTFLATIGSVSISDVILWVKRDVEV